MSEKRKYRIPQESLEIKPIPEVPNPTFAMGVLQEDGKNVILEFPELDYPVVYPVRLLDEIPNLIMGNSDHLLTNDPPPKDIAPILRAIYINLPNGKQVVQYKIEVGDGLLFKSEILRDPEQIRQASSNLHSLSHAGAIHFGDIKTVELTEKSVWEEAIQNLTRNL